MTRFLLEGESAQQAAEHFGAETAVLFGLIALTGILVAGLLAGLETGIYSLSHVRLSIRAARGDAASARLAREYARPRRLLSTLLVANALAGWVASFGVSQIFDGLGYGPLEAVALDLLVLVPVVFLFGEVLPKDLFRVNADRWMPRYAGLLTALRFVLCASGIVPLVTALGALATRLFGGGAQDERREARARVAALLAEGAGSEGLSETQLGFADRVFTMRGITVDQEMLPWKSVASIAVTATPAERAQRFLNAGVSRLPVVDAAGKVTGVVAAVDHFARPRDATAAIARPVLLLGPGVSALDAIGRMRRERVQMAVVGDRIDRPLGIVSIKDLVEPLVGDLAAW
jgi:CBS domain containing-hemolysin-like protein